jgi:hypothetical protein
MTKNEELYIKGFNSGYIMARHEPELLKKLVKATPETEYIKGMKDGQKEHEKEMLQQRMMQQSKEKDRNR